MKKKVYHIHLTSKIAIAPQCRFVHKKDDDIEHLYLGEAFEDYLLDSERVSQLPYLLSNQGIDYNKQEVAFLLEKFWPVKERLIHKDTLAPNDLLAGYRILQRIFSLYSLSYPDWKFALGRAPAHRLEGYNVTQFNFDTFAYVQEHAETDLVFSFIVNYLQKANIQNEVILLDFFWPGELTQIMFVAKYLKENGNNTVVLDASEGDEQVDFTQWSQVFLSNPELFAYFDAYIVYQDYDKTKKQVLDALAEDQSLTVLENVVHWTKDKQLSFKKPSPAKEDELFAQFVQNQYTPLAIRWRPSCGYYMNIRLLPYKCYWSACHFCTINSSHLYAYNSAQTKRYIDAFLDFLEHTNEPIDQVFFQDEAIHPNDMFYFASEILRRNIQISYSMRTRFEKAYTAQNCALLKQSGMCFVGMGLEAASDAINISVNKGKEVTLREKMEIIQNFNEAHIFFHNYAILGFPHETKEDVLRTKLFLQRCFEKFPLYGYGANVFGLNKGGYMINHPQDFGIRLVEPSQEEKGVSFDLRARFEREFDMPQFLADTQEDLHAFELLPHVASISVQDHFLAQAFFVFLFRTGRYFPSRCRPYDLFKAHKQNNQDLLLLENAELLAQKLQLSPYLQATKGTGKFVHVSDWASFCTVPCLSYEWDFLQQYKNDKTLWENLKQKGAPDIFRIRLFLKNYFFLPPSE